MSQDRKIEIIMQTIPHKYFPLFICILALLLPLKSGLAQPIKASQAAVNSPVTEPANKTQEKASKQNDKKVTSSENKMDQVRKKAKQQIESSMENIEVIQQTLDSLREEIDNSKENTNLNRSSVRAIKDGLELIDGKLKEAYSGLDESRTGIANNSKAIDEISTDLLNKAREVRTNAANLTSQKSLIEDNSIRLYELLINISDTKNKIETLSTEINRVENMNSSDEKENKSTDALNNIWQILATILAFLAPMALVISNIDNYQHKQHQTSVLIFATAFLGYFILGFGIMYGDSVFGWIGTSNQLMASHIINEEITTSQSMPLFLIYQMALMLFASMIVYKIIGHYLSNIEHVTIAVFTSIILVPIAGHWTSASTFIEENKGWLEAIGFVDQSTIITISTAAAFFALALLIKIGKPTASSEHESDMTGENTYSDSSLLLLWLGLWGIAVWALPISSNTILDSMLHFALAGSAAALTAWIHYLFFYSGNNEASHSINGFITALITMVACSQVVTLVEAMVIGAISGLLQNITYSLIRRFFLKQKHQKTSAYLIAIHATGGIWGALCIALFGSNGNFSSPEMGQLITQLQGVVTIIIYSLVMAHIAMFLLKPIRKWTHA